MAEVRDNWVTVPFDVNIHTQLTEFHLGGVRGLTSDTPVIVCHDPRIVTVVPGGSSAFRG